MIEPKRLLDARGAPDDMVRLLRAARREVPPHGLRKATWQALAAKSATAGLALGTAGAVASKGSALAATAASGTGAVASTHAMVSKGMLLWVLKSAAVCGGVGVCAVVTQQAITGYTRADHAYQVATTNPSTARRAPTRLHAQPRPEPIGEPIEGQRLEGQRLEEPIEVLIGGRQSAAVTTPVAMSAEPARDAVARAPAIRSPRGRNRDDTVGAGARLEAQRVAEIRQLLRQGDGRRVLAALNELDHAANQDLLRQERDALRIDALVLLRNNTAAARLVQRFRQRYPNSPFATRWTNLTRSAD